MILVERHSLSKRVPRLVTQYACAPLRPAPSGVVRIRISQSQLLSGGWPNHLTSERHVVRFYSLFPSLLSPPPVGRLEQSFLRMLPKFLHCPESRAQTPSSPCPAWACSRLYTFKSWVIFGLTCRSGIQGERAGMHANEQADLCKNTIRLVPTDFLEANIMVFPLPCHIG